MCLLTPAHLSSGVLSYSVDGAGSPSSLHDQLTSALQTPLQAQLWVYPATLHQHNLGTRPDSEGQVSHCRNRKTLRWKRISHQIYNVAMCLLISEIQLQRSMKCLPSSKTKKILITSKINTYLSVLNSRSSLNSPKIPFLVCFYGLCYCS